MQLSAGDHLGPYMIAGPLGAGGMGDVYRARDARLERDVAIKILRADALADPEWRARFAQEARAVCAVSHPNIVTVHDIGTDQDVAYMVMELVEGQTLDRLIPSSGLRISEVLRIGAQIADGCAKAHAAGVIHRDLKPANIMVQPDGRVKVLDFGIAKLVAPPEADPQGTRIQMTGTHPGMVLGTAAYMSPEQAEGRPLDARSDIFSLGAVLYEMATGQRAFRGESPVSVMAAVLQQEPPPAADLRQGLPPELVRLVMRCLRKDPGRRVQTMADLKVALEELREEADSGRLTAPLPAMARPGSRWPFVTVAGVAIVLAAVAGFVAWCGRPSQAGPDQTPQPMPLTSYAGSEGDPSFSPDGTQLAFRWNGEQEDNPDIYVMMIGGGSPLRLTTDPRPDFGSQWSPDGRNIAFMRGLDRGRFALMLVPPLGGRERSLGEFSTQTNLGGGLMTAISWTPDGRYLILSGAKQPGQPNQILRVAVDGGDVTTLAAADGVQGYDAPALSKDGRTLAVVNVDKRREVDLLSLSAAFEPGRRTTVPGLSSISGVTWTPDSQELILSYFVSLPLPLYRVPVSGGVVREMTWVGPGAGGNVAIHGRRMVFERNYRDTNIVRVDLASARAGTPVIDRIGRSSFRDVAPQYSPDGTRLAFYSNRGGSVQVWTAKADGTEAVVLTSMNALATTGTPRWSPDGRQIAFDSNADGSYQVYLVGADGGRPHALTSGPSASFVAAWSRDGRWIYFSSDRSGQGEIWRMPPGGGTPEQVTHAGGSAPALSPDGAWLYFTRGDGAQGLWRMPIAGGVPTRLAEHVYRYNFAVTSTGVYYVTPGPSAAVRYVDLATGVSREVIAIDKPLDLGLALSPDGRYLLFTQVDYMGQDLMLVENFR